MKNIRLLLACAMALLLFSCSSDDSGNVIQGPVAEKILGKWYIKSLVENGKDLNYTHHCAEEKDYMWIDTGERFFRFYNADCTYNAEMPQDYVVDGNAIILNFLDPIIDNQRRYTIVRLTDNELVLKTSYGNLLGGPDINLVLSYTRQ